MSSAVAGSEYLLEHEGHDDGTTKETWSQLPILLLWMIMERLQFIDNLHLAAVCRHWHYASTTCPLSNRHELQAAHDRLPWLMSVTKSMQWNGQLFNFLNGKRYTIHQVPSIDGAFALGSKKGWLLLANPRYSCPPSLCPPWPSSPVFLLNAFTRTTIQLPEAVSPGKAAISTMNGTPNCVALACAYDRRPLDRSCLLNIQLIHPADENQWKSYELDIGVDDSNNVGHVSIFGDDVYVGDQRGRVFRFNMIDCTWTEVTNVNEANDNLVLGKAYHQYILESDGEVMKIVLKKRHRRSNRKFDFLSYKLNANRTAWVKLNIGEEMGGKMMFLYPTSVRHLSCTATHLSFVARAKKSKSDVCQLHLVNEEEGAFYMDVYDLVILKDQAQARRVSRKPLATDCLWVDLG